MCAVSAIGDYYSDRWRDYPLTPPPTPYTGLVGVITRAEFDKLKNEVEEMKRLLRNAKEIDAVVNEPDCEMDEKLEVLRRIASLVGVDLEDVLGAH